MSNNCYESFCSDCKKDTEVVFDHSAGDTVCSECGLVLESCYIDETSEWRTFANDSNDHDPNRVGGASNPLLDGASLGTGISKGDGRGGSKDALSSALGKLQNCISDPDCRLIVACKAIDAMCERLGLPKLIQGRAGEIYKKVEEQKSMRGRNQDAMIAACIYIACRQEGMPRTVKEICFGTERSTKKEIGRAKEAIVRQLEAAEMGKSVEIKSIHAGDLMKRFCSNLGMSHLAAKAAREAVLKAEEIDIRRNPTSIAAVVMYMVTQLSDDKKFLKDISGAAGVAEGTIRGAYKDIYPHASRIIPSWYAREEDIRNLTCP